MDGGKRLRSVFVLGAAGLFCDDLSGAQPAAEAVEMFHNFTLLHDDIMDNAALRRGRESVYAKWGANVAILSGDALMILAYGKLAELREELLSAVLGYFNEAAVAVCEGQQLDMDYEAVEEISTADYLSMIERKTAALFVGAVSMGAVVGGASEGDIMRLREFALQFGVAFQMQDDLLDTYGDERLGKRVGGDILEGKKTFLALQVPCSELDFEASSPKEKVVRTIAVYDKYGARAEVEAEIERRFELALRALDSVDAPRDRIEKFKEFAVAQLGRSK